jgi:hypothetical protein
MGDHLIPGPPTDRCESCGGRTWTKTRLVRDKDQVKWVEYTCTVCADSRRLSVLEVVKR